MGEIQISNGLMTYTVAEFENGTVYDSSSMWKRVIGYYGNGYIENAYHKTVAKYNAGTAYELDSITLSSEGWKTGAALCYCTKSLIYEGGSSWNNSLGSYEGDPDGACAAAVLYFSLASEETKQREVTNEPVEIPGGQGNLGFWGGLAAVIICALLIYIFWFTDNGREMLFEDVVGRYIFGACILSTIISSFIMLCRNKYQRVIDILGCSVLWHILSVVLVAVIMILDEIAYERLTFWMCAGTLLFAPFIVVGVAAPIVVLQVAILSIISWIKSRSNNDTTETDQQDIRKMNPDKDINNDSTPILGTEHQYSESLQSNQDKKRHVVRKIVVGICLSILVLLGIVYGTIHNWTEATCTEASVCTICGKERSDALGHAWVEADCLHARVCSVCNEKEGYALSHVWQEATCIVAKTCLLCGTTDGDALGHNWQEATSTTPKTCITCGVIEGNVLSHNWQEATCVTARTCLICGTVEGSALDHDWAEATFDAPKTCLRCGITEGEKLSLEETETAKIMQVAGQIGAGGRHTVILKSDGTAIASGAANEGQCDVGGWNNLVAVYAGDFHSLGLRDDGTVVAAGRNTDGQCNVLNWQNITMIAAGDFHTLGLRADGTVVATGKNNYGQCDAQTMNAVANGRKIIGIAAGYEHSVVLFSDGTVYGIGSNKFNQINVSDWENVIAVFAGVNFTVGLRSDGKVYAVGENYDGQLNVGQWNDIVFLAVGDYFTIGIDKNGFVLRVGRNSNGQINFDGWHDVVAIGAGHAHTVAIGADGNIYATGDDSYDQLSIATVPPVRKPDVSKPASSDSPTSGIVTSTDPNLYIPSINRILDIDSSAEGMLYDIDDDGVLELIVIFIETTSHDMAGEDKCSVFDIENGSVVARLNGKTINIEAAVPTSYVGVAEYNGKKVFMTHRCMGDWQGMDTVNILYDPVSWSVIAEEKYDTFDVMPSGVSIIEVIGWGMSDMEQYMGSGMSLKNLLEKLQ